MCTNLAAHCGELGHFSGEGTSCNSTLEQKLSGHRLPSGKSHPKELFPLLIAVPAQGLLPPARRHQRWRMSASEKKAEITNCSRRVRRWTHRRHSRFRSLSGARMDL